MEAPDVIGHRDILEGYHGLKSDKWDFVSHMSFVASDININDREKRHYVFNHSPRSIEIDCCSYCFCSSILNNIRKYRVFHLIEIASILFLILLVMKRFCDGAGLRSVRPQLRGFRCSIEPSRHRAFKGWAPGSAA
ncbi:MAG: hypothetical protein ACJAWY_001515 [Sphingomonas echinoides]|jgi:hypothetical protein